MYRSLALVFLSGIGFSFQTLLVKELDVSVFVVLFFRGVVQLLMSLMMLWWTWQDEGRRDRSIHGLPSVASVDEGWRFSSPPKRRRSYTCDDNSMISEVSEQDESENEDEKLIDGGQYESSSRAKTNLNAQSFVTLWLSGGPLFWGGDLPTRLLLLARALTGFFAMAASFSAIHCCLSLGDGNAIYMLSPVMAGPLASLFLGEPYRCIHVSAGLLSVCGLLILSRPAFLFGGSAGTHFNDHRIAGLIIAIFGAFSAACSFICVRVLGKSYPKTAVHPATCMHALSLVQILASFPMMWISGQPLSSSSSGISVSSLLLVIFTAFLGAGSQFAMTVGMRGTPSAAGSAMRLSDVIFSFLWQLVFTPGDAVQPLSLAGGSLICASILLVVIEVRGQQQQGEEKSPEGERNQIEHECRSRAYELVPITTSVYSVNAEHSEVRQLTTSKERSGATSSGRRRSLSMV